MMGTGPFAVPTFEALLTGADQVVALVTRPSPSVRKGSPPPNPMRESAIKHGVQVFEPTSINSEEGIAILRDLKADLFVVCDYGQILSREALGLARLGGINLHGSLLPKYRGAAPVHWAIIQGDSETGISVIHMTPRLDGGPILVARTEPIRENDTMPDLEDRLSRIGVSAVIESIDLLRNWDGVTQLGTSQDPTQVTKAPRFSKEMGLVDWSMSGQAIRNRIRAFKPWPGTYSFWHRTNSGPVRLLIDWAEVVPNTKDTSTPGEIILSNGKELEVACGHGEALRITRVQPAGKKPMQIDEFLRGYPVKVGERFGADA